MFGGAEPGHSLTGDLGQAVEPEVHPWGVVLAQGTPALVLVGRARRAEDEAPERGPRAAGAAGDQPSRRLGVYLEGALPVGPGLRARCAPRRERRGSRGGPRRLQSTGARTRPHRRRWARCRRPGAAPRPPVRSTGPVRRRRGPGRGPGRWGSRSVPWPRSRARTTALAWPWRGTLASGPVDDAQDTARQDDPGRARLDAAWKVWIDSQEAAIQTVRTRGGGPPHRRRRGRGLPVDHPVGLAGAGVVHREVGPVAPPVVPVPDRVPQAPRRQPRRPLRVLRARRDANVPPRRHEGRRCLYRSHLRHTGRAGPGGRQDGHDGPGPCRPVRARAQRRGGHPHRARRRPSRHGSEELHRDGAGHRAAGCAGDLLRPSCRQASGSPGRVGGQRAAPRPRRRRAGRQARVRRSVRPVRGGDGREHVARHRRQREQIRRDRPAPSMSPPRTTRSGPTATPR